MSVPVYFELSWAILSTIGLVNVGFGVIVLGITGFSPIAIVPIVVSAAGAVANGLCYYAFYADYPVVNTAVASVFADLTWLVQEAGLSFYSYLILSRVLQDRSRTVFMAIYWTMIAIITVIRIIIVITRVKYILGNSQESELQDLVDHLHVGYFSSIVVVEIVSSVFLLRRFRAARKFSMRVSLNGAFFSYLMRSTEIRLAMLALIGAGRAGTYSFQETAQSATTVASQLDRFAYTLECMFPTMMFMDILASRLVFSGKEGYPGPGNSSQTHPGHSSTKGTRGFTQNLAGDFQMEAMNRHEWRVDTEASHHDKASSQEHIIDGRFSGTGTNLEMEDPNLEDAARKAGISRTVEFTVLESRADAAQ